MVLYIHVTSRECLQLTVVDVQHEGVEMNSLLTLNTSCLIKQIHQHGLTGTCTERLEEGLFEPRPRFYHVSRVRLTRQCVGTRLGLFYSSRRM